VICKDAIGERFRALAGDPTVKLASALRFAVVRGRLRPFAAVVQVAGRKSRQEIAKHRALQWQKPLDRAVFEE
jgi:hypothetical protein